MKIKAWVVKPLLILWILLAVGLISIMGANHYVAWKPALMKPMARTQSFVVSHILAPDCQCSQYVLSSLKERNASADYPEEVVWLGKESEVPEYLIQKGYSIRTVQASDFQSSEDPLAVPTLLVTDKNSQIIYAGGYSHAKISSVSDVKDLEIVSTLMGKGHFKEFPIFGCATSHKYRKAVDPFSIKYFAQTTE